MSGLDEILLAPEGTLCGMQHCGLCCKDRFGHARRLLIRIVYCQAEVALLAQI